MIDMEKRVRAKMKFDVLIVGGGVVGCAAAYYLSKQGRKVLVLEKNEIGGGGSGRNGGGVRQTARDSRELPLAKYAVKHLWPTLSQELGIDIEYRQLGNLRLGKTEEHIAKLRKTVEETRATGIESFFLQGKEIRDVCPYVSDEIIAVSFCPSDGHANPLRTTLAFYQSALRLGATFMSGVEVHSLLLRKNKLVGVITDQGNFESECTIVASGLESRSIVNSVGIDLPIRRRLIEALVTDAQPKMFGQMIGTADNDFYGHQTEHGSFVFGGASGLEEFAEEGVRPVTRPMTAASICRAILKYFPCLGQTNIVRTWAGFVDKTPDSIPIIGKVDFMPQLILACGFNAHGFGLAPAVGKGIAELAMNLEPSVPLQPFGYDRFKPKA
jgi:sarcosine oxidase subunit beta